MTSPSSSVHLSTSALDLSAGWFLKSGIQEGNGGVARYYHSDVHKNAHLSTEITGYAVSSMVFAWTRRSEPLYLDSAVRAGDFLCDLAWSPESDTIPFELPRAGSPTLVYFFDLGIIVRGLLRLYVATTNEKYLSTARATGLAMIRDFPAENGFPPILELPSKAPLPYTPQWSRGPGCYQLKSALGWYELFRATKEEKFLEAYERALELALASEAQFLPDPTAFEKTMDRLHSYSYFLEALMPVADHPECAAALTRGIERVSGYLRQIRPTFVRSDVNAQLLRVRLYADALGAARLNRAEAEEEVAAIESFQVHSPDPRIHGGFYFGKRDGQVTPFVNPVSAAFCSQALELWSDFEAGRFTPEPAILI